MTNEREERGRRLCSLLIGVLPVRSWPLATDDEREQLCAIAETIAREATLQLNDRLSVALCRAETQSNTLTELRTTITTLESERDREKSSKEFTQQWYAERLRRLRDMAEQRGFLTEYSSIVANGTGDSREPPTYAQLLNTALHRAESAAKKLRTALTAMLETLNAIRSTRWCDHRQFCPACQCSHWDDKRGHDEKHKKDCLLEQALITCQELLKEGTT